MNNCPIFISSADSYSDLWPIFFDMFKKYWPDYSGLIYLNTEEKSFSTEGLDIICTHVGKSESFGITFRKGLDKIQSENVFLVMIDYILMGRVNNVKVVEYYDFFKKNNLDSLCLIHQQYPNQFKSNNKELSFVNAPAKHIMFSYQMAFWRKSMLYQMALPHEDPWTSEWYGTLRAEKMHIKLACISDEKYNPIPYHGAGCLHKGKWLNEAIEHLNRLNYNVDFDKRGYYLEPQNTISNRIKIKWKIIKSGLMGSYYDLFTRKKLYDN